MPSIEQLRSIREQSAQLTKNGPPTRTSNPFFGVGPITDMTADETDARLLRFEYDRWIEENYPLLNDQGQKVGKSSFREFQRSIHRGFPADTVLRDMVREIHRYFEFPSTNKMAAGIGGGHTGFTVCALNLLNANDPDHHVYVDTPMPESVESGSGGFFRQSWGTQLIELQKFSKLGDVNRLHFSESEGIIPSADELESMGIRVFMGVGHETTAAMDYSIQDIQNLIEWVDRDPDKHHAVIDSTSMIGAMPWGETLVNQVISKCCMFMPLQKAIGGNSGYFIISLTTQALRLINKNQNDPSWSIPRQVKLALPLDPMKPLSSEVSTDLGPIYDPVSETMASGIINTYSTAALAETRFGLLRSEKRIGSVAELNRRSVSNRNLVIEWVGKNDWFDMGVGDETRRGAAVTLLKAVDADFDDVTRARIVVKSKQLLGYEGITHINGQHEAGLDTARHVNAYPGTPGDYRAWIGGTRDHQDITALLENLQYAYHRARIAVVDEMLREEGESPKDSVVEDVDRFSFSNFDEIATKAEQLRDLSEQMAAFWGGFSTHQNPSRQADILHRYGQQFSQNFEQYQALLKDVDLTA
jgi:phosphoserine aminotransferase